MSNTKTYDKRHGGPWDRGSADSYYGRGMQPHYYTGPTRTPSDSTYRWRLTAEELEAYKAGYDDNEVSGDRKYY